MRGLFCNPLAFFLLYFPSVTTAGLMARVVSPPHSSVASQSSFSLSDKEGIEQKKNL
jgi:hypothetical protein